MLPFVLRRLLQMVLVLLVMTMFIFGISRLAGDPRYLYMTAYSRTTLEEWEARGETMGLNRPLAVQYGSWLANAVRGDFGESIFYHRNALDVMKPGMAATLQLVVVAFAFALAIGIPLGVVSAIKRGTLLDYLARSFALAGQAVPPFWLALILVLVFAVQLGLLPTSRRGDWTHYVLPVATLAWLASAAMLRLTRSAMLEILDSEYIKFARSKGVHEWSVIWKHALKNALIPPLTLAATTFAHFLTGTVVVETIFAWPGIGRMAVQATTNNDFPLITGLAMVFAAIFVIGNFLADMTYGLIDPRIRYV